MKQEDKDLLLKVFSELLPYRANVTTANPAVKLGIISGISVENKITVRTKHADIVFDCTDVKPYLRPIESMTKVEMYEIQEILGTGIEFHSDFIKIIDSDRNTLSYLELQALFGWLNAHHFDYYGLIPKGLALLALEGMYKN